MSMSPTTPSVCAVTPPSDERPTWCVLSPHAPPRLTTHPLTPTTTTRARSTFTTSTPQAMTMSPHPSLLKDDRIDSRSPPGPNETRQFPSSVHDLPELCLERLFGHGVRFADSSDQVLVSTVRISRQHLLSIIDEALSVASTEGDVGDRPDTTSRRQRQCTTRTRHGHGSSSSNSTQEHLQ